MSGRGPAVRRECGDRQLPEGHRTEQKPVETGRQSEQAGTSFSYWPARRKTSQECLGDLVSLVFEWVLEPWFDSYSQNERLQNTNLLSSDLRKHRLLVAAPLVSGDLSSLFSSFSFSFRALAAILAESLALGFSRLLDVLAITWAGESSRFSCGNNRNCVAFAISSDKYLQKYINTNELASALLPQRIYRSILPANTILSQTTTNDHWHVHSTVRRSPRKTTQNLKHKSW